MLAGNRQHARSLIRGQSTVEFALGATLALVLMLVGIQFAIIGQSALAVSQGSSALARYGAINTGGLGTDNGSVTGTSLPSAAQQLLSSSLTLSDLTVTVASYSGTTTTTTSSPQYGDRIVVSLSFNAADKVVLPSSTLLGISFPTTLTGSDSQMYE